jgi:hypothetical protein
MVCNFYRYTVRLSEKRDGVCGKRGGDALTKLADENPREK